MITRKQMTVENYVVICDFCSAEIATKRDVSTDLQCNGCQKHVCLNCAVKWKFDPWTAEYLGDYWVRVCSKCEEKSVPFAKLAENIRKEAEKQIARLEDAWKSDCRYVGFLSGSDEHAEPAV